MDRFSYQTRGVCSRQIDVEIEDGVIKAVKYHVLNMQMKALAHLQAVMNMQLKLFQLKVSNIYHLELT